jgi:hypothetical protein
MLWRNARHQNRLCCSRREADTLRSWKSPLRSGEKRLLPTYVRERYRAGRKTIPFGLEPTSIVATTDRPALAGCVCAFRARAERVCQEQLVELDAAARLVASGTS